MGLQCSRQGYIQDFHELHETRLAPEGQCFPVDLLKNENAELTSQQIKQKLTALLQQDEKLAKRLSASLSINAIDSKERVLCGREDIKTQCNEIYVDLPPEGKVANEDEFVELPYEKCGVENLKDGGLTVELPYEEDDDKQQLLCHVNNNTHDAKRIHKDTNTALTNNSRGGSDVTTATDDKDDQWMFTLYDFQENGIVTKQDVNRLMDSICSVVTNTLTGEDSSQKDTSVQSNNLKVHLEIGRRKKSRSTHQTSAKCSNRYQPSRNYKGMIFPPPNSEEAEKVSSYIEERVHTHRRRVSQGEKKTTSHKDGDATKPPPARNTCRKCSAHYNIHNRHASKEKNYRTPDVCAIPKRKNTPREDRRKGGVLVSTQPLIHLTNSKSFKDNDSYEVSNSDHSLSPSSLSGTNTPFSGDDVFIQQRKERNCEKESGLRFGHSCSCHRKPKIKCCDNIYNNQQHRAKHNEHSSSKHREFRLLHSSRSSSQGDSSSTSETTATTRNEQQNPLNEGRNAHRKKFRRHTNDTPTRSSERPEVWPGSASSVADERPALKSIVNQEQLCFCKRMLGLDHPCNHPL